MKQKIEGIYVPHMVPLLPNGDINEPELRRYISWMIDRGVHGLYPNGSTGEFLRFTPDERARINQIVIDEAGGRVPVLAGAAESNTRETIKACELYHSYGARAVAIVSPFYYNLSSESVYAYFHEIATNSPIDVTLYNIPMFASPIDVPTIKRLSQLERVAAIKDSSGDIGFASRVINAVRPDRPDFVFLTGWDLALVPMLLMGADGGTNALAGVVPEVTRQIFDAVRAGQIEQAKALQFRILDLFEAAVYSEDFPEGVRAAVELRGFNLGPGRQPISDKQRVDIASLRRVLQCMIADFGLADPPAEGCPPRTGGIDQDRIAQITQGVIDQLRQRGVM